MEDIVYHGAGWVQVVTGVNDASNEIPYKITVLRNALEASTNQVTQIIADSNGLNGEWWFFFPRAGQVRVDYLLNGTPLYWVIDTPQNPFRGPVLHGAAWVLGIGLTVQLWIWFRRFTRGAFQLGEDALSENVRRGR